MFLRPAEPHDFPAVWSILRPIIRAGETLALDRDMSEADALASWCKPEHEVFVAELDGQVVGTYYIRSNQAGGGRHVCNCGYAVKPAATGRGVARAMCAHSFDHARRRGERAMQFNFVVSTNTRAVALWESFGFRTIGRLPGAVNHPALGYVDALVMFRDL